jgi:CRISPR-associated endonuclease Csn1
MKKVKYYLGLDVGTDSVGYAVTDEQYNLLKFHGEPAWGAHIFDAGKTNAERRSFRTARRRLERRKQRVGLLQEIFAKEIAKVDERFFVRLAESYKYREDAEDEYTLFNDKNYTDKQYHKEYPTIHHLIVELMNNPAPHDARLVYLACAWLVAHRGHFLDNLDENNISKISDITESYNALIMYFSNNGCAVPWEAPDLSRLGNVLKDKTYVKVKEQQLIETMFGGKKPKKDITEEFPFSLVCIIRLLAGGTCKVKELFGKEEYEEFDSVSLGMDEEKHLELASNIGDDYELIAHLRSLYDWAILNNILNGAVTISGAKVHIYEQHKADLELLKRIVRDYIPGKYAEIFRYAKKDLFNYPAYTYHVEKGKAAELKNRASAESFSKALISILKQVEVKEKDKKEFDDMMERLALNTFLPKQKNTDNRVIPHQVYLFELKRILENAENYLAFLGESDMDGITNAEKIVSIFKFKIPYFVGPLNDRSDKAWLVRKTGKIMPWNFEKMVDLDKSEENFIRRMTNKCTYLPGEDVLPKDSLCYQKFMVLNEINNIKINGEKIPVEVKQGLYTDLFEKKNRVTKHAIIDYLISNGYLDKGNDEAVTGIDVSIKSSLSSRRALDKMLSSGKLSEDDAERIIERSAYAENKSRLSKWIEKEFPNISVEDRKYLCSLRFKDFGRLSRKFLSELEGAYNTGEITTILSALWNTNDNLMEIIATDRYRFKEIIEEYQKEYYTEHKSSLESRLDDMYVSTAVRRPIYRTMDIVNDICKAFGTPEKIFIEMTRGEDASKKGKKTNSRLEQIQELYSSCKNEEVRELKKQLESLGEYATNRLQGDRLFLYFMQFGRCAYSNEPIQLEELMQGSKRYDIDHIYPQSYVKDDSIHNNKVLCLSELNGKKQDVYPISAEIRNKMKDIWAWWYKSGTITEEKYKRLTRSTPFSDEEKYGFINRQLVETSQSTKALGILLGEKYPKAEIVYSKAGLVSSFRQVYDIYKSRSFNDLHHAVDAYLNIVTGNVYNMKFSKKYFNVDMQYSMKTENIFKYPVKVGDRVIWDGEKMRDKAIAIAKKNNAHFTMFSAMKTGEFFKQMLVKKSTDLVPRKAGVTLLSDTERYGGYNKPAVAFYIPTKYRVGKKEEIIILSVELMNKDRFLSDSVYAKEYAIKRLQYILGKTVDEVVFPMGMRALKVNTVISFDGYRAVITGVANKGMKLLLQGIVQLSLDDYWKCYIKRMDNLVTKVQNNKNYVFDSEYDKVIATDNVKLYDILEKKFQEGVYSKRPNSPYEVMTSGREMFMKLTEVEQANVLLTIIQILGRVSGGSDLSLIGGNKNAAAMTISTAISNWKKYYTDVRIIDQSPSGLWEKQSINLFELL